MYEMVKGRRGLLGMMDERTGDDVPAERTLLPCSGGTTRWTCASAGTTPTGATAPWSAPSMSTWMPPSKLAGGTASTTRGRIAGPRSTWRWRQHVSKDSWRQEVDGRPLVTAPNRHRDRLKVQRHCTERRLLPASRPALRKGRVLDSQSIRRQPHPRRQNRGTGRRGPQRVGHLPCRSWGPSQTREGTRTRNLTAPDGSITRYDRLVAGYTMGGYYKDERDRADEQIRDSALAGTLPEGATLAKLRGPASCASPAWV